MWSISVVHVCLCGVRGVLCVMCVSVGGDCQSVVPQSLAWFASLIPHVPLLTLHMPCGLFKPPVHSPEPGRGSVSGSPQGHVAPCPGESKSLKRKQSPS